jgi:ribosome biogenesis GTPase
VPDPLARLVDGVVVAAYRRHFAVLFDDGATIDCVLKGRSTALACGDRVQVARVAGGGAIEAVLPRSSLLYRSDAFKERLIAANVTQVVGVVAPDIGVDLELVHRWAIAAQAEQCRFVIAANKSDLPGFDTLLERLAPLRALGYPAIALAAKRNATPLAETLAGERTVLIGQSGMGKSTILNAIVPGAAARTREVSSALRTGRHTTSETALYLLPDDADAWIVDSPGMKVFGLAHLAPDSIAHAFRDIAPFLGQCRFRDCRHESEPGCAVQAAVARGEVAPYRLALLQSLVRESKAARAPGR